MSRQYDDEDSGHVMSVSELIRHGSELSALNDALLRLYGQSKGYCLYVGDMGEVLAKEGDTAITASMAGHYQRESESIKAIIVGLASRLGWYATQLSDRIPDSMCHRAERLPSYVLHYQTDYLEMLGERWAFDLAGYRAEAESPQAADR